MKTALFAVLLLCCSSANAATAFLMSCQAGTSVTGRFVYTGTYNYGGQMFNRTFTSYCPYSIEIY